MSLACEEVCNSLHINGDARARETIAARVIELARRGERCPTVLRDRVLAEANAGIRTVGEIRKTPDADLRRYPRFGRGRVAYLRKTLGGPFSL